MFNQFLVHPLFNLLAFIYAVIPGHDFGVAVIIMTIIVRLLLWPIVARQLHSQKAMQELAPEVAKVKAKAKGDKQLESKMLMDLYKEKEINPFASLVPLFIQLPIFFALFSVLSDVIKPGAFGSIGYDYVKDLGVIKDIIVHGGSFNPRFLGLIDMAKPNVILAVTTAATQYFQTKMLMPSKPGDAQGRAMANMTNFFPVLSGLIALTLPSALALYWTTTSLVAILQQRLLLNQDAKELGGDKS